MKRTLFLGLVIIMLAAALASPVAAATVYVPVVTTGASIDPLAVSSGPQTYTVLVGWDNGQQGAMINAFFPAALRIHPGDTVKWVLNSVEFHTVTFLAGGALPPFVDFAPPNPYGPLMVNPLVLNESVPAGGIFDDSIYINSGIMQPSGDPKNPTSFSLTFPKVGVYPYVCVVHGVMMSGTIEVVSPSTPVLSPAAVKGLAKTEIASYQQKIAAAITDAFKTEVAPVKNADGTTKYTVQVGYSNMDTGIDLMGFFPNKLVVNPGDTVEWQLSPTNLAPHTVTFLNGNAEPELFFPAVLNGQFTLVLNGAILGPINGNIPLDHTHLFHSGFMDPIIPIFPKSFTLTIGTDTGTYDYMCMLHDMSGMLGTVQVVLP